MARCAETLRQRIAASRRQGMAAAVRNKVSNEKLHVGIEYRLTLMLPYGRTHYH